MTIQVARPDAASLVLRAFGRALHPDLLCHHKSCQLQAAGITLELRLIAAGHALIVRTDKQTLTEVISDPQELYPTRGRLFERRFKGNGGETVEFENGLRYEVCCTLERMTLSVYLRQHEELLADSPSATLFVESAGVSRLSPGPLSLVRTEACRHSLIIHSFHTFPQQLSIVKTQSLVELND